MKDVKIIQFGVIVCSRGIAQWIKHSSVIQTAWVKTQIRPMNFSAPILSGTPAACPLSPNGLKYPWNQVTSYGREKKRGIMVKSLQLHLSGNRTYMNDVWEKGG